MLWRPVVDGGGRRVAGEALDAGRAMPPLWSRIAMAGLLVRPYW
jgi:hypothetical protein